MSDVSKVQRSGVNLEDFEQRLYASSGGNRMADDPLAELSRIVGKADPFKGLFANVPAAGRPQRQEPSADIFQLPGMQKRPDSTARPALAVNFAPPQGNSPAPKINAAASMFSGAQNLHSDEDFRADPSIMPKFFDENAPDPQIAQGEADFFSHTAPGAPHTAQVGVEEYAEPLADEAPRGRSRRGMVMLMGILLLAAIGTGAAIGLRGQAQKAADGSIPVIKAATNPVRVEPPVTDAEKAKQEADAAAAAKDSTARVTTKEEQPVEIIQPPGSPPIKIARIIPLSGEQAHPATDAVGAPQPVAPTAPGVPSAANGYPEAKPVKTVSVRPDGTIIGVDKPLVKMASAVPAAPAAPVAASDSPAADTVDTGAQPADVPVPQHRPNLPLMAVSGTPNRTPAMESTAKPVKASTPKSVVRALPTTKPVQTAAAAAPLQLTPQALAHSAKTTRAAPVQTASSKGSTDKTAATATTAGIFAVQLAAPTSEAEAKTTAARFQSQYAAELSGHHTAVHKADLGGGRVVYRVRVPNLSRDEAVSVCEKLRASGGQCFITR